MEQPVVAGVEWLKTARATGVEELGMIRAIHPWNMCLCNICG
jgi:hypothetical protein